MSSPAAKAADPRRAFPTLEEYKVGYGKPPLHTRWRKGVSANPRGRPPGMSPKRAKALALKEACRVVTVREGDKVLRLPVLQAVMRAQLALAVKGHNPAQRAVLTAIAALEQEIEAEAAAQAKAKANKPKFESRIDAARRLAFLLAQGYDEAGMPMPETFEEAVNHFFRDEDFGPMGGREEE